MTPDGGTIGSNVLQLKIFTTVFTGEKNESCELKLIIAERGAE